MAAVHRALDVAHLGTVTRQVNLDTPTFETGGQTRRRLRASGEDDHVCVDVRIAPVRGDPQTLRLDAQKVTAVDQHRAVGSETVQNPPAADDRKLSTKFFRFFQHGDLPAPLDQELGQLQAHQATADNGHPSTDRHPPVAHTLNAFDIAGDAQQ